MPTNDQRRVRMGAAMLLATTLFWGLSFPVMKALLQAQAQVLPEASSWFLTSSAVAARFGIAALLLLLWSLPTLRELTRSEVWQGFGLGVCGGVGLIFQMDGLAYTSASTSAFLTQCYCLILPAVVAWRERRSPSPYILVACLLVFVGVGVLAQVDWRSLRLGRGEWETLLGSLVFTGQILWLDRPGFARNRVTHFSLVMFVTMAMLAVPVGLATMHELHDWVVVFSSERVFGFVMILVVFCTLIAFVMMNRWQPHVPVTEAGLIYGAEPVFASLFALFLPAWLSRWAALNYQNEVVTPYLIVGGGLISTANLLVQLRLSAGGGRKGASPVMEH